MASLLEAPTCRLKSATFLCRTQAPSLSQKELDSIRRRDKITEKAHDGRGQKSIWEMSAKSERYSKRAWKSRGGREPECASRSSCLVIRLNGRGSFFSHTSAPWQLLRITHQLLYEAIGKPSALRQVLLPRNLAKPSGVLFCNALGFPAASKEIIFDCLVGAFSRWGDKVSTYPPLIYMCGTPVCVTLNLKKMPSKS